MSENGHLKKLIAQQAAWMLPDLCLMASPLQYALIGQSYNNAPSLDSLLCPWAEKILMFQSLARYTPLIGQSSL